MGHKKLSGNELDKRFMLRASKGPIGQLKKMLAAYPHLLESRWDGRTALTEACRWEGPITMAKALLEAGADPNAARLDDPQFRPLRMALRNKPDLVPMLLQKGATPMGPYPGQYTSDSTSDLLLAAQVCPQNIPDLLAAGADPNATRPEDYTALGYLLSRLPKATPDDPTTNLQWSALVALVDAGATLGSRGEFSAPDVFYYWRAVFGDIAASDDARRALATLQNRIDKPGTRRDGHTFLHAIAEQLQTTPDQAKQKILWQDLLGTYGEDQVGQWLLLDGSAKPDSVTACMLLVPNPPDHRWHPDAWKEELDRLLEALEWAKEFSRVGANPNETNTRGYNMATSIAARWPWMILRDANIRKTIGDLGLDFMIEHPNHASAAEFFSMARGNSSWPKPEPGEIEALLLDSYSPSVIAPRVRTRL